MTLTMKLKWGILVSMMTVSFVLLSGCTSTDIGGAGAAATGTLNATYNDGELTSVENVPLNHGWLSTLALVKEMQSEIQDQWKNEANAQVVFRDQSNNKIDIKLLAAKEGFTTFRIKVGSFGDEIYSQEILSKLRRQF